MSAYVDGELTGAEMLEIRRHLSECAECSEEHEAERLMKLAVSRLRTAVPRKDLAASIIGRLDEVRVSPYQRVANSLTRFLHSRLSPVAAALAASGLALVLLSAGGIDSSSPSYTEEMAAAPIQNVDFVRELNSSHVSIPGVHPLPVADPGADLMRPNLRLISLTTVR